MKNLGGSFFVIFFSFFPITVFASQTSLVEWTFPSNGTNDALADGGIFDNLTQQIGTVGTNPPTFPTSGVASASGWATGATQKYWLFNFSTLGYENIALSMKIGGSATGPRDFVIQYRIGESGTWQNIPNGSIVISSSSTTTNLSITNLTLPTDSFNYPSIFIRFLATGTVAINSGAIGTTGSNRLDDIIINGTPIEEEVPVEPTCRGEKENVTISEILPAPKSGESEYAELHNSNDECDLSGWRFTDSGTFSFLLPEGTIIEGNSYLTFIRTLSLNNSGDTLTLFDDENVERSLVSYPSTIPNYSYSFNGTEWLFSSFHTPGAENIFDEITEEEVAEAGHGVILNEIFPNPLSDEHTHEFIELKNITPEEKNLKDWSLVDASQKMFTFEEDTLIAPHGLFSVPRSSFGFSLNNTGSETVRLLDPQGNTLSQVEYTGSQENFSYSFDIDSAEWRWTKSVTPGEENHFSKQPKVSLTSSPTGYADIPLVFTVAVKNAREPYRYSWDFGDGRRSALKEPKHSYEKIGSYRGSVTVHTKDGSVEKRFTITIKKYPSYAVLITALHPNPEGKDTGSEWIEIKNMTQKTLDLTGWKIATGSDELTNHLLLPGIVLKAGATLRLNRSHAAFTLSNSTNSIELRYPNNKPASRAEYKEEVPEGATCSNKNGHCDFADDPKKESKQKKKETIDQKEENSTNTPLQEKFPNEPPAYPSKKEILSRIGTDFNLLMNQLFLDSPWIL